MATGNVMKFGDPPKKISKIGEFMNYFTSNRGRNFSQKFMGVAAFGISSVFVSYQTYFIDYYLDFIRAYK